MAESICYTTYKEIYDALIAAYQKRNHTTYFQDILFQLLEKGCMQPNCPEALPFQSTMDEEAFFSYLLSLPIRADLAMAGGQMLPGASCVQEREIIPTGRDVFFIVNMPYITDIMHCHNFFEITYVLKGECRFLFEDEHVTLCRGDVCIVSPSSAHSVPLVPECHSVSIIVRKSTFDSVFGNLLTKHDPLGLFFRSSLYEPNRANYILLKTGADPMPLHTLQEMVYECIESDETANACAVCLLNLFLARTLRTAKSAITLYNYEGYPSRDFQFSMILQYIQKNFQTVTLSDLAYTFHFSETYLCKMFRKRLNQNFTEIVRTIKMRHAANYLTDTSMKISEIAEAVGYDSVDHFSRTFHRTYQLTPREYRNQHHQR